MFCQNCLIIVFQDALKALNLTHLSAADLAHTISERPPRRGQIAPEIITEAIKLANYWHDECLKLATSTVNEQPTLTSYDRRACYEQAVKWAGCAKALSKWSDAQVTP